LGVDIFLLVGIGMQPVAEVKPICLQSAVKNTIEMLGKSHVLEILYFLSRRGGPVRFNELKRELSITATTLSRRLEEFIEFELITREVFAEVPARVEYTCSTKGKTLGPVLRHLFEWVDNNKP
jgi:DNA-binding HxlR family transcriptional regulator